MTDPVYIGIDLGTTVLKAAAFDGRSGRALAVSRQRLPLRTGPDGCREQPAMAIERGLTMAMSELRRQLGNQWKDVQGLGVAAQGGSTCIVEEGSAKPLTPMILWNDTRGFSHMGKVKAGRATAFWQQHTMRDEPCMGLPRLLWLREKKPTLFRKGTRYAGAGDFLFYQLTETWLQDAGNALQTVCYNARKQALDPELLAIARVDPSFVSPLRKGHATHPLSRAAASRFALPEGLPVAGPYMDHEAGYLAAATTSKRPLQCSLGTAWVGNVELPADARWNSSVQLVLPGIMNPGWLVVQPLLAGNLALDWALQTFVDDDLPRALAKLSALFDGDLLPPPGLTALPWLYRASPVDPEAVGAGTIVGLNAATTEEDLFKAVAVSLPFEMARVFGDVCRKRDVDCVVLGGGASKGGFFVELLAALFHPLPVRTFVENDLFGARGALYAVCRRVAAAKTRPIPKVREKTRARVQKRWEQYLAAVDLVYGAEAAGTRLAIDS